MATMPRAVIEDMRRVSELLRAGSLVAKSRQLPPVPDVLQKVNA